MLIRLHIFPMVTLIQPPLSKNPWFRQCLKPLSTSFFLKSVILTAICSNQSEGKQLLETASRGQNGVENGP